VTVVSLVCAQAIPLPLLEHQGYAPATLVGTAAKQGGSACSAHLTSTVQEASTSVRAPTTPSALQATHLLPSVIVRLAMLDRTTQYVRSALTRLGVTWEYQIHAQCPHSVHHRAATSLNAVAIQASRDQMVGRARTVQQAPARQRWEVGIAQDAPCLALLPPISILLHAQMSLSAPLVSTPAQLPQSLQITCVPHAQSILPVQLTPVLPVLISRCRQQALTHILTAHAQLDLQARWSAVPLCHALYVCWDSTVQGPVMCVSVD
jgi:hypothetical protein